MAKLLQELFAQGILTEDKMNDLQKQVQKTGKTEEDIILSKNIVSEDILFNLKSKILGIPLKKVNAEQVSLDVLGLIPEEASTNYKMASVSRTENSVQVAMVYPEDISAQNALRFLANKENLEMAGIESGADDVSWSEDILEIYAKPENLENVKNMPDCLLVYSLALPHTRVSKMIQNNNYHVDPALKTMHCRQILIRYAGCIPTAISHCLQCRFQ